MAKSYSRRSKSGWKDLWSPRPMRYQPSNKVNKVLCHRIERAWEAIELRLAVDDYHQCE